MLIYRTVIVDMDWMNHLRCPAGWHTSGRPLQRVMSKQFNMNLYAVCVSLLQFERRNTRLNDADDARAHTQDRTQRRLWCHSHKQNLAQSREDSISSPLIRYNLLEYLAHCIISKYLWNLFDSLFLFMQLGFIMFVLNNDNLFFLF